MTDFIIAVTIPIVFLRYSIYLWTSRKSVPRRPWAWFLGWFFALAPGYSLAIFTIMNFFAANAGYEPNARVPYIDLFGIPSVISLALGWFLVVYVGSKVRKLSGVPEEKTSRIVAMPLTAVKKPVMQAEPLELTPKYCNRCGKALMPHTIFCSDCGAKVQG